MGTLKCIARTGEGIPFQYGGPIREKLTIRTQSWERIVSTSIDCVSLLLIPQQRQQILLLLSERRAHEQ
jgi:hypothetical protein